MSHLEDELARQMQLAGISTPEREYRFAYPRRFRFDFSWPEIKLAVEVEGGTWVQSRHTSGAGYARDCEKYNIAAVDGWKVLRFTGDMIKSGQAVKLIQEVLYD